MSQELRETEKELRDLCRRYALAVCNGEMMFYDPDGDGDPPYEAYDIKYTVDGDGTYLGVRIQFCLLYTSPSPRDGLLSRMPSSA